MGTAASSPAASLYWGSAAGSAPWSNAANWYQEAAGSTAATAAPGAADDAVFNITSLNGTPVTPVLTANTTVKSLVFDNTVSLNLAGSGGNRNLDIGSGGITVSGTAAVTIGDAGANKNIFVKILESQTWTNHATTTLNIRNSAGSSNAAAGPVVLTLNAAGSGNISNSGSFSDGTGGILALVIDSEGTGTVSMGGGTYSGGTTVKRGVFQSGGNLGTGAVTLGDSGSADARIHLTGTATSNITVQGATTGLVALSGSGADYQGSITLNRDLSVGSTGSNQVITISGVISGTGNLTIGRLFPTGATNPTVTLSGANTYTGKTNIESATVIVSSFNSVVGGTASSSLGAPVTVANGTISLGKNAVTTLRYTGAGETTDRVLNLAGATAGGSLEQAGTGLLKFTSNLTATGSGNKTLTLLGSTAGTGEISGAIVNSTGTTAVTKTGGGTWRLSGLNSYTGVNSITGGVLEVVHLANGGEVSSLGQTSNAASSLSLNGGTLRYVGTGASTDRRFTIASALGATLDASGTGAVSFTNTTSPSQTGSTTSRTLTLTGTNTDANTLAANLANAGMTGITSLTKDGAGRWVLTGATTYTGATAINGGTLQVNGSLAAGSAVALNAATLGGTGTVNGLVTTAGTDSMIAPGTSAGTLSLAGGLNAAAGATFDFELGTSSDLLSLGSGTFTGSTAAGGLRFNFTGTPGLAAGNPYTLLTFGLASGLNYSDLVANVTPAGYQLDGGFGTGGFLINADSLQVQFAAVPEPSSWALLAGGVAMLGVVLRRRKA